MEEKKVKTEKEILVVNQLPTQQVSSYADKDGKEIDLITVEDALTEILKEVRIIKKAIA